jgi:hypothetical protein
VEVAVQKRLAHASRVVAVRVAAAVATPVQRDQGLLGKVITARALARRVTAVVAALAPQVELAGTLVTAAPGCSTRSLLGLQEVRQVGLLAAAALLAIPAD